MAFVPAMVVMMPFGATFRIRSVAFFGNVEAAVVGHGDAGRVAELGSGRRPAVAAEPFGAGTSDDRLAAVGPHADDLVVVGQGDVQRAVRAGRDVEEHALTREIDGRDLSRERPGAPLRPAAGVQHARDRVVDVVRAQRPAAETDRPCVGESLADRRREVIGEVDLLTCRVEPERRPTGLVERLGERAGLAVDRGVVVVDRDGERLRADQLPPVSVGAVPDERRALIQARGEALVEAPAGDCEMEIDRPRALAARSRR